MLKSDSTNLRTGGRILVDQLVRQGVEHVFCVPGESYLAALDAMYDANLKVTVCRQEAGATMMAATSAILTGRPGICFVTRGPGATNAAHGLHIAEHDSTPLILFIGQVERGMLGRGAFQEMDYRAFLGSTVKWATQIEDAARIPEIIQRAFHVAMQGRPGPVAIALPEDVLTDMAAAADAMRVEPAPIWPGLTQMAELQKMLWAARRPIAIVGGGGWDQRATQALRRFAERFDLPVAASFRRGSLFDGEHQNYAGEIGIGPNPKLKARIAEADLVVLIGGRMAEMPSQSYTLFEIPTPRQTLVHIHPDPHEIGRVYHPTLGIVATAPAFCAALEGLQPPNKIVWSEATRQARADYLEWTDKAPAMPGKMQLGEAMLWLRGRLDEDAIVANGAGNYAAWPGRFLRYRKIGAQIGPTSGSMGYGVPAAVGAKRVRPDRMVVSFNGDGCFLMNGQEFATAVQYDLAIVFIVIDNGMYGTIRMHQEREYPGRISATALKNPDFAAYARAFGGHGETVEETSQFAPAFERAVASGKPSILHVKIDPDAISPTTTLSAIRAKALAGGK
ncbi:MAG TPA: thiamine pyrophosphate-binding protein [Roseiarcus sp.]|nr:thiamine pyrophosphate-binding protein [Roseiarcus sp.]